MSVKKWSFFNYFLLLLYLLGFSAFLFFLFKGSSYYLTPLKERPFHDLHEYFKPGGVIGHGLGILGTSMMVLMLGYTVRKRFKAFKWMGNQKNWLNFHIFLGILGPMFVTLHTSFKFNGIVAVSFWSMIIVALSGFVGRYLYVKIPGNILVEEERLDDLTKRYQALQMNLLKDVPGRDRVFSNLEQAINIQFFSKKKSYLSILDIVFLDMFSGLVLFWKRWQLSRKYAVDSSMAKQLITILKQKVSIEKRLLILGTIEKLFHYWHVAHRPFSLIMFIILIIHITVAALFGYTWLF